MLRDETPSRQKGRQLIFMPATRMIRIYINLLSPLIHLLENINFLFKHFLFLEIHLYRINLLSFSIFRLKNFPQFPVSQLQPWPRCCCLCCSLWCDGTSARDKTNADLLSLVWSQSLSRCFLCILPWPLQGKFHSLLASDIVQVHIMYYHWCDSLTHPLLNYIFVYPEISCIELRAASLCSSRV